MSLQQIFHQLTGLSLTLANKIAPPDLSDPLRWLSLKEIFYIVQQRGHKAFKTKNQVLILYCGDKTITDDSVSACIVDLADTSLMSLHTAIDDLEQAAGKPL